MVNPDKEQAAAANAASDDAAARQAAEIAVELTEASDFSGDAAFAGDDTLDAATGPDADASGDQPRSRRTITGALTAAGSGVARRSSGIAKRTTGVASRRTQAVGRRTQAVAAAAGRSSRAAGRGGRTALTWLTGQVIAMGPRLRIRNQETLRAQFPGRDDLEIASLLIDRAARAAATVGGATGAWSALPVLPAFPAEIAAETLAVVGIEIKLVGELHEILGVPAEGNVTERARAYIGAWAHRRGVYAVPGGLLLLAGSPLARQLRRRLAGRVGRSAFSLGPLLTGAFAGAMINRRETRKLGKDIMEDLRRHKESSPRVDSPAAAPPDPGAGTLSLRYGTPRGRWVLAATVLGSGLAALDATVVGIALPAIARDFHVGVDSMQWVVDAYTLTLAGLLLLGGALGDTYGRRKVFVIGTAWFALASLACGLAPNVGFLIAARAMQGVGAAMLTPGSLAILQASFAPADRAKAIGAWSGLGGVATAIGPFLGGWLISAVSWRLVFFINLPLVAAVIVIARRHVPESHAPDADRKHIDVAGAVTISLALAGITYGLIDVSASGWTAPPVLASLAAGVAFLVAFVVIESRERAPMLPLGIFRARQFSAANAVTFVVYGALGGVFFLLPVTLQQAFGYSALAAGAALLPVTAIMLAFSARSAALATRIGPRLPMTVGPLLIAAGMVLFARLHGDGDYLTQVLPAAIVFGIGTTLNVAPLTATAMSSAPAEHSGIASAVNNDVARAAGLIAVAVLPVAAGLTGTVYLHPDALVGGFHRAVLIAAAVCAAGGLLAAITIRNPPRRAAQAPGAATDLECMSCAIDGPPPYLPREAPAPLRPPGSSKPRPAG